MSVSSAKQPKKQAKTAKSRKTVKKDTEKKPSSDITKKDSSVIVKKIGAVSDSNKVLSKELKSMSKIFSDNQKVLISIRDMIDTLASTLEQIQKQSKQMNMLEEDTQRLFSGLNQVRAQASAITKINDQATKLQEQINRISEAQKEGPDAESIVKAFADNQNSIQNNTHMIIKIGQRIDTIKEDLDSLSTKTESISTVGAEIDKLREKIQQLHERAESSNMDSEISSLRQSLSSIMEKTEDASKLGQELESIKDKIGSISDKAEGIEPLGAKVQKLQDDLFSNLAKTEAVTQLSGQVQKLDSEISSLVKRADATAFVGESLKSVQDDFASFKDNMFNKTNTIDQKVSAVSDLLKRSDASMSEFHKKTDDLFQSLGQVKSATTKSSSDSTKEVMALLKLSEFQSNMRMLTESKYGELKDIEKMAEQTASLVNLFDGLSVELQDKMSLPPEVRQWAISKMLDSADRWEIRFPDLFSVLIEKLGKETVKDNIRIQQVRDIFGIRGVDEIRKELGIA